MKKIRSAIYTRKSSIDGLEQAFNSLDAQREACAAYIKSQKHEGWVLIPDLYDDGGVSGGTMERPALQRLMQHVDEGLVDQIVVYKIDRLTRSLSDFAKLVDQLDAVDASFTSVTQSFNTATSMGRLTMNVLLSFAQFEREVTAERIRDKIAASKKKGMWMGGAVPLGYQPSGRTLKIVEEEAATIRTLYQLYQSHGAVRKVKIEADRLGLTGKSGKQRSNSIDNKDSLEDYSATENGNATPMKTRKSVCDFGPSHLHYILTNPVYAGRIRHKKAVYEGQHPAIIDSAVWDAVQIQMIKAAARPRGKPATKIDTGLLIGKLLDEVGDRLTPSHTSKNGKRYRYYVSQRLVRNGGATHDTGGGKTDSGWRLPAKTLEQQLAATIINHVKKALCSNLLCEPDIKTIRKLQLRLQKIHTMLPIDFLKLVLSSLENVQIKPGQISITLSKINLAKMFAVEECIFSRDTLNFRSSFQYRKRGVEMKLVVGDAGSDNVDTVLIHNIAIANAFYDDLKSGKDIAIIAKEHGISKRRILQLIDLAFLSPEVVKDIFQGQQPLGLTTERLLRCGIPVCWAAQKKQFATL